MRRYLCVASILLPITLLVGGVSGQTVRPAATLDDILAEVRGLRGGIDLMLTAGIRAQLLTTRLSLQEQRIRVLTDQLAEGQRKLTTIDSDWKARSEHIKRLEDLRREATASPGQLRDLDAMLTDLRHAHVQSGLEVQTLRAEENELRTALSGEHNLWIEFNARLDELEAALTRFRQP